MLLRQVASWLMPLIGLISAKEEEEGDYYDDRSALYAMINRAREAEGLQALYWSSDLAAYAQVWANEMASGAVPFSHDPSLHRIMQGETLYVYQGRTGDTTVQYPLQAAAQAWLGEATLYNGMPIVDGKEPWLHWSQCMWSTTTQIGCSRAYSNSEPFRAYAVCRFYPEGNYIGQRPF